MTRVLLTGGTGMLGHKLVQVLSREFDLFCTIRRGFDNVAGFGIFDEKRTITCIDATDHNALTTVIREIAPDVVINAVGLIKHIATAADTERMIRLNTELPHHLADLSAKHGFRFISVGTDCVFSGAKGNYDENDEPDATDDYGKSKRLGEVSSKNCLTVRTSIIGRELDTSHSLIEWFLSNRGGKVKGFTQAIYTGFPTIVFAELIARLIKDEPDLSGLYHVASDPISKFELLQLVSDAFNANVEIEPVDDLAIDRSLDSTRFRSSTGLVPESWPKMIERMAADPTPYEAFHQNG